MFLRWVLSGAHTGQRSRLNAFPLEQSSARASWNDPLPLQMMNDGAALSLRSAHMATANYRLLRGVCVWGVGGGAGFGRTAQSPSSAAAAAQPSFTHEERRLKWGMGLLLELQRLAG